MRVDIGVGDRRALPLEARLVEGKPEVEPTEAQRSIDDSHIVTYLLRWADRAAVVQGYPILADRPSVDLPLTLVRNPNAAHSRWSAVSGIRCRSMRDNAPIPRASARIIVLDERGQVLLFSASLGSVQHRVANGRAWFTPGGRVDDGETLLQAAARELREETGLTVESSDLGPVVAETSGVWTASDGTRYLATDSFFKLTVLNTAIDTAGFEDFERSVITGHRWWSCDELDATTAETVWPHGLSAVIRRLADGVPKEPVWLPWHGDG